MIDCFIDNFVKNLYLNEVGTQYQVAKKRNRKHQISYPKMITILIFLVQITIIIWNYFITNVSMKN